MTKKRAQGTELEQFAKKTGRGARGKVSAKSHNNAKCLTIQWTGGVGKNIPESHTKYDLYRTG